jgi:hypothetical protein
LAASAIPSAGDLSTGPARADFREQERKKKQKRKKEKEGGEAGICKDPALPLFFYPEKPNKSYFKNCLDNGVHLTHRIHAVLHTFIQ